MSDVENQEVSDADLLNDVLSDQETTDSPVVAEEPEKIEGQTETETAETVTADKSDERPPIPPKPEWRLKEDAERARAAEAELANERAEKAALKQRLEALERPAPKVEETKKNRPDPLLDPDGYAEAIRAELREEALAERREESLSRAREANQQEFDEAYAAARQAVDPALKARMQASRDPGKTLLEWNRERKVAAEVGNDPAAYKQRLRDELLKDPEFRKQATETWKTQSQHPDGRPRIDLGPSLNAASRANTTLKSSVEDVSDADLFTELAG